MGFGGTGFNAGLSGPDGAGGRGAGCGTLRMTVVAFGCPGVLVMVAKETGVAKGRGDPFNAVDLMATSREVTPFEFGLNITCQIIHFHPSLQFQFNL